MTGLIFAYITAKNQAQAENIGMQLVNERLAACINVLPGMLSIYEWEGQVQKSEEAVLIAKTTKANFEKLEARVRELHDYDNPCIVAFDIVNGSKDFLKWIDKQSK